MATQAQTATSNLHQHIRGLAIVLLAGLPDAQPLAAGQDERDTAPVPSLQAPRGQGFLVVEARALDKITARITDLELPEDTPVTLGSLIITARYCYSRPPEETPETYAFLEIDGHPDGTRERLFTGWMIASSPALNALEHSVYDVWVTGCHVTDEQAGAGTRDNEAPD